MPIDINILGEDGKRLFKEWNEKVKKHNKYTVKNKYHKEHNMDMWHKELNDLNNYYRKALKAMESEKKKEMMELKKAVKEAENRIKTKEQAELTLHRSSGLAKKPRCPNGTRRSKKSGNCEKKSMQSRKRCPNGTRRNKKSGNCE